jgi:tRNA threonylcarbamoyladenosine biosynthesis protein TsaE
LELPVTLSRFIRNEEETTALAKEFVSELKGGEIIVLDGELGAGKTFFIKKGLESLGISNVSSPTFALINEYYGKIKVYHFDFYRIKNVNELYDIGYDDYLNDDEAIIFIEWGNLFPQILPQKRIDIEIKVFDDFSREINIKNV